MLRRFYLLEAVAARGEAAHEAGYDSCLTALVMILLSAKLEAAGSYTEPAEKLDTELFAAAVPENAKASVDSLVLIVGTLVLDRRCALADEGEADTLADDTAAEVGVTEGVRLKEALKESLLLVVLPLAAGLAEAGAPSCC